MMKSLIVKEMTLSEKLDEVLEQIAAQEEKDKVAEAHISQLVEKLVTVVFLEFCNAVPQALLSSQPAISTHIFKPVHISPLITQPTHIVSWVEPTSTHNYMGLGGFKVGSIWA